MSNKKSKQAPDPPPEELHRVDPDELKKLGIALFSNQIFTTFHIDHKDQHLASSIFMPILFMTDEDRTKLAAKKPVVFYEYYDKAGPRGINGYPIFSSMRMLVKEDWAAVVEIAEKMKEAAAKL